MNFTADFLSKSMANTLEAEEYYEVSGRAWKGIWGQFYFQDLSSSAFLITSGLPELMYYEDWNSIGLCRLDQ